MLDALAGFDVESVPRFDAGLWELPAGDHLGFVKIPAGSFSMDGGGEPHRVDLPDYWIARWPTTVGQFRCYVADSGAEPGHPDCLAAPDDHPVNWVSWYEAMGYCAWLESRLLTLEPDASAAPADGSDPQKPSGAALGKELAGGSCHVSLPSEAEWEKAARGADGAAYPWGDRFDPRRCNTRDAGVGGPSPVGSFPAGASPYGVHDMSGNVWSYLRTVWGPSLESPLYAMPYDPGDGREDVDADPALLRCARGGAFTVEPERAKSTFRDAIPTDSRDDADGFRVVISPLAKRWERPAR